MSVSEAKKRWLSLIDAADKARIHDLKEEIKSYPWRKHISCDIPESAKAPFMREYEVGLVYPMKTEITEARKACGVEENPPTAHTIRKSAEDKQKILKEMGILRRAGFDEKKKKFNY